MVPGKSSIVFALFAALAIAQEKPLPKFEDFPVADVFKRQPAPPVLRTRHQQSFRTRIREAASKGPNFAGHYTIAEWGCGSNCSGTAMVDEKTGETFDQPFKQIGFPPTFDYADESAHPDEMLGLQYKVTSRLVVVHGCPEGDICASYYLEWTGSRFKVLLKLPAIERKN